jgi:hypothetical protein
VYAGCYARRYEGRYTGVRIGVLQDFMLGGLRHFAGLYVGR